MSHAFNIQTDPPVGFVLKGERVTRIEPVDAESLPMLPDDLVIPRGAFRVETSAFDLSEEGLWRFIFPGRSVHQRIVFESDVDALLSAIAWISIHGKRDVGLSHEAMLDRACSDKISLTCGHLAFFSIALLRQHGIRCRIVSTLTLEDWNAYDNGHTMVEVHREDAGKWVLYDFDLKTTFRSGDNTTPLSLVEFCEALANERYNLIPLSAGTALNVLDYPLGDSYNHGLYLEATQSDLHTKYRRAAQSALIFDEATKVYYFTAPSPIREKIESYSKTYQFLPSDEFMNRFYESGTTGGDV